MIVVGIYIKNLSTLEFDRVELFNDEKISVTSSIQNVNNIGATYSDFSQTFTVPATKNNNKIFKHWYENSLDTQFSTLVKADAYIELDTIPFRSGKIQLESCDIKNGEPQSYSITFIGNLGSLKDKFAGLLLKDLDTTAYDDTYAGSQVRARVVDTDISLDIMYPLISSGRYWNYGYLNANDINNAASPIRYNELFPAVRLKTMFNIIETTLNVNLQGTTENPSYFLTDQKFINAYLYLKNAENFVIQDAKTKINFTTKTNFPINSWSFDLLSDRLTYITPSTFKNSLVTLQVTSSILNVGYNVLVFKDSVLYAKLPCLKPNLAVNTFNLINYTTDVIENEGEFEFFIDSIDGFEFTSILRVAVTGLTTATATQTALPTWTLYLKLNSYMPEIKIEDFFSSILKMFNLTCYSNDGINYTIDTLDNYYNLGSIIDLTEYIKSDTININKVKTYKKINFLYEKSESLVNVGFNSYNGVEYGNLLYNTNIDGEEYNVKLLFEDLNFNNLIDKLQVGYALKTDLQKYIPKPIILYDYNPTARTVLTGANFYFSEFDSPTNGISYDRYKAFGQEYFDGTNTYSLNFPEQVSTLTNQLVTNSLYQTYYSNYISNIFNYRARLIKVSAVLPISILTSLKLNNRVIIRDKRYIINSFTTDLTTGEASFELLTDLRIL